MGTRVTYAKWTYCAPTRTWALVILYVHEPKGQDRRPGKLWFLEREPAS